MILKNKRIFASGLLQDEKTRFVLILALFFIISVIVKIIVSFFVTGPSLLGDEVYYRNAATSFFNMDFYRLRRDKSPFLYPFLISPAMLAGENFYIWMLVINAFMTSLLIIPVWLISRLYLDRKTSLYPAIISLLIPFQYTYSKTIMSENIYFPIFLFSIYAFLKARETLKDKWVILFGLLFGLTIIARDQALMVFLPFLLLWWLPSPIDNKTQSNEEADKLNTGSKRKYFFKKRLFFFFLFICFIVVALFPMVYIKTGGNILDFLETKTERTTSLVGLGGAFKSPHTKTELLIISNLLYSFYIILAIAPFITVILLKPISSVKHFFSNRNNQLLIHFLILSVAMIFLVAQFSTANKFFYQNYYLLGRYIFYCGIFWIIYAFIVAKDIELKNIINGIEFKRIIIAISVLFISSALIFLAYITLIQGSIWKIPDFFILPHNGADAFYYKKLTWLIWYVLATVILTLFIYLYYKKKLALAVFLMSLPFLIGPYFYSVQNTILDSNRKAWGVEFIPGKKINQAYKDLFPYSTRMILYNGISWADDITLYFAAGFWALDGMYPGNIEVRSKDKLYEKVSRLFDNIFVRRWMGTWFLKDNILNFDFKNLYDPYVILGEGLYVTDVREDTLLATQKPNLLEKYSTKSFNVYKVPFDVSRIEKSGTAKLSDELIIKSIKPNFINLAADSSFYIIEIKCSGHNLNTQILLNDKAINTINTTFTKSYLLAKIPNTSFHGDLTAYELKLYDSKKDEVSAPVILKVNRNNNQTDKKK